MKNDHPIFSHWDVWGWVYGVPLVIGVIAAIAGYPVLSVLCIFGVAGSFGIICTIHALTR